MNIKITLLSFILFISSPFFAQDALKIKYGKQTKYDISQETINKDAELAEAAAEMTEDEIKEIHKAATELCNEKHNIFMWTIDKYLHESEQMMKELGYELHARMIWDKENGIAPAFTVRFSHEYLLWFYKKGNILMPCEDMRGKYTTVLREASTKHSKKPVCAYEMIESMFPNATKLEMFARQTRDGWDCWGNEV